LNLKHLDVIGSGWKYNNFNYSSLSACVQLQTLFIADTGLTNLDFLSNLTNLRRLEIGYYASLIDVSAICTLPNLKYIYLHPYYSSNPSFSMSPIVDCLGAGDTLACGFPLPADIKTILKNNGVILWTPF
jgi:hypothetical protein